MVIAFFHLLQSIFSFRLSLQFIKQIEMLFFHWENLYLHWPMWLITCRFMRLYGFFFFPFTLKLLEQYWELERRWKQFFNFKFCTHQKLKSEIVSMQTFHHIDQQHQSILTFLISPRFLIDALKKYVYMLLMSP